ncbi:MAG: amylo-alpha-1,6-glucosidase [Chloroflexota bacterium]|nr:amylo-alpha-1,6-glucosidase [Chloroflexota bacterium]
MLDYNLVLKSDELFLVGDSTTDGSGEPATGLYARDTRHLSRFRMMLNRTPLDRLSARVLAPTLASIVEANRPFAFPDGTVVPPQTVSVEQRVDLGAEVRVSLMVRNFTGRPAPLTLSIRLAADFRDLFGIRGFPRQARGRFTDPRSEGNDVVLGYVARDGLVSETRIAFDQPPAVETLDPAASAQVNEEVVRLPGLDGVLARERPPVPPSALVSFSFVLAPGEEWRLSATVTARPAGGVPISGRATLADGQPPKQAVVATGHEAFDRFYQRCELDLASLQTTFPEGTMPAAGIPWFVAPFGRDSLIVGLQTYHSAPARAAATLRVLAALQGTEVDPDRDEEPGKILHEMRHGEMARLGEVPHTPYFGTVDATPLFVLLFAETVAWTGDERLYRDLLPNARRAVAWIDRYGDLDGDGFVEYRTRAEAGAHISHQGWKDSHDSLHHPDGRPAEGAIALVEVQGYVYAALARLAEVAAAHGDPGWARELGERAERMRSAVEDRFWMDDERFYAQALDGDKTPVRAISSNPGHLLFCGLPRAERAAEVARRVRNDDLDSGWGVRTLAASMASYNPMSYHNGSVWPHDNSLLVAGLLAYGHQTEADRIAAALLAAAAHDPLSRLPELYCGFARAEGVAADEPVPYPVSCSPQAWAAGVGPLLIRTLLSLRVDVPSGDLVVEPMLPAWLREVRVDRLTVRGQDAGLSIRREGGEQIVEVHGPIAWRRGESPNAANPPPRA